MPESGRRYSEEEELRRAALQELQEWQDVDTLLYDDEWSEDAVQFSPDPLRPQVRAEPQPVREYRQCETCEGCGILPLKPGVRTRYFCHTCEGAGRVLVGTRAMTPAELQALAEAEAGDVDT